MNKQGPGTMIDWTDWSWNPIGGCKHGCSYCYIKAMDDRFGSNLMEPKFHTDRLYEPAKKKDSLKIFVGSAADMWGDFVPHEWIDRVLAVCKLAKQHDFLFLTKNPIKYSDFDCISNAWYGTTIDGLPFTNGNLEQLCWSTPPKTRRFISFEPLLAEVHPNLYDIDWIIIGADSSRGAKKPPKEWADILIDYARNTNTAVWMKDNYGYPERIKEWPKCK